MKIENIRITKWINPFEDNRIYRFFERKKHIDINFHLYFDIITHIEIYKDDLRFLLKEETIDTFEFIFNTELIELLFFSESANKQIDLKSKKNIKHFNDFKDLFKEYI